MRKKNNKSALDAVEKRIMDKREFNNYRELAKLDYFELLPDGRLALAIDNLNNLVDFHVHLGWTVFIAPPVDITKRTAEVQHNFEPDLAVNLDVYSGQNFYDVRPKWGVQDYLPCAISPRRRGKHHTHTIPNILWEMDALKIDKAVCLALDVASSDNWRRFGIALRREPRVVNFCAVHPKHKERERLIEESLALGAMGMKVHPELQMTPVDSEEMISLMKLWSEKTGGLPVLFHCGYNGFEPKKAREHADIEHYEPATDALGDTPCIFGHSSMNQYPKAVEIAKKYSNVFLELSGQPPAHIKDILDNLGEDRLLYGTDWPVYPQAISMAKVLIATEDSESARIKLLRDNGQKLLYKAGRTRLAAAG